MLVRDRMSKKIVAVSPREGVERARSLMERHGLRHLPVLRNSRLVGILSDRDLRGAHPPLRRAEDIMAPEPVAVSPDDSVDEAARAMQAHGISALPVVEGGRVVGMLTTTDVLRAFVELSGAAEPTTRIVLSAPSGRGAAEAVRRIVQGCHAELKWMHRQGRHLHLRLKGRRIDDLITALEAAGFDVTAVVASRPAAHERRGVALRRKRSG